ncbi:plastocyanin [Agrococcus sp. UYP10]|uniref:cupredoxin domain-containing protein n=1 Tax=Agrococcus sp. UYP10 TaxID=1756355 RepID=UPI0033910B23
MTRRRTTAAALIAAMGLALAACSGGTGAAPSSEPVEPSASTAPSASSGGSETAAPSEGTTATALIGMVGTADDPDAYEIALTDESGAPVTTLPAGDYTLTFADRSAAHNFHLTGPGGVDIATDLAGVDESTVEITLEPGTYLFVCDPHVSSMSGQVEVTA